MRSYTLTGLIALSAAVCFASTGAEAKDLILHQRVTTTGPRAGTHEATQYWTATQMVTDSPDNRVIVDIPAETMTVADKHKQTYFTETFAEMRQQSEAMKAAMQKQMENMSPQMREQMAKMGVGPAAMEAPASVKPTGKTEKIAGYQAKEYVVESGPLTASIWATDALQIPGGSKAREALSKMVGGAPGSKFAQAMTQLEGVPLRTVIRSGSAGAQGYSSTTEVTEVSEKTPPADAMKIPADYKKVPAPSFHPESMPAPKPR